MENNKKIGAFNIRPMSITRLPGQDANVHLQPNFEMIGFRKMGKTRIRTAKSFLAMGWLSTLAVPSSIKSIGRDFLSIGILTLFPLRFLK